MLSTNDGSWKSTGPDGVCPRRASVTDRPLDEILRPSRLPSRVGKLVTDIVGPAATHWAGTPRPTMSAPSARCATSESSRTLFAWEIPQAWGEDPWPAAG